MNENCEGVVNPPRKIPFSLKDQVKNKLDELEAKGILAKVDEPTAWVSNMVIAKKKNGDLRICIDPKHLNT